MSNSLKARVSACSFQHEKENWSLLWNYCLEVLTYIHKFRSNCHDENKTMWHNISFKVKWKLCHLERTVCVFRVVMWFIGTFPAGLIQFQFKSFRFPVGTDYSSRWPRVYFETQKKKKNTHREDCWSLQKPESCMCSGKVKFAIK